LTEAPTTEGWNDSRSAAANNSSSASLAGDLMVFAPWARESVSQNITSHNDMVIIRF